MPAGGPSMSLPRLERPWPDVQRYAHGPLSLDVAPQGFRNLALDGWVVVRELYPAVRAPDWSTLALSTTAVTVAEPPSGWQLVVEQQSERFHSATQLRLVDDGTLVVRHRLQALAAESVNRWGLNLCLDAEAWAGSAVMVQGQTYRLPFDIGPQRRVAGQLQALFPASSALALRLPAGGQLTVTSEGQELEVEDQRNWTDPTYKIYSGPLEAARPVVLPAGAARDQELRLSWAAAPPPLVPRKSQAARAPVRELPRIGVQLNETASPSAGLTDQLAAAVTDLGVDHIRLDTERPLVAHLLSALPPVDVELAVLDSDEDPEQDRTDALALAHLARGRTRLLWHRDRRRTTTARDVADLPSSAGAEVVPGTDAYFADLNRDRPAVGPTVSFSITPVVHTRDSQTVFASLATQAEVVRQAASLFEARVVVSPITLGVRGAPESAHDAAHRAQPASPDPRLATLEGAAWTLGSVHALVEAGAASGTWHELFGAAGLITREGEVVVVRPAFHALAALQAVDRPEVRQVSAAGSPWVGLHLLHQRRVVIASLRPWPQSLDPRLLGGQGARRRRLREQDLPAATRTRAWWRTAPTDELPGDRPVDLDAFEISLFDLAAPA